MGSTDIHYCHSCGVRVPESDVIAGLALHVPEENHIFCRECTQAAVHNAPTGTDLSPVDSSRDRPETLPVKRSARRSSRSLIPAVPSSDSVRRAAAQQTAPPSKAPAIAIATSSVIVLIAIGIFVFGSRNATPVVSTTQVSAATQTGTETGRSTATVATTHSADALHPWAPSCVLFEPDPDDPPELQRAVRLQQTMARYAPWNPCPSGLPAPFSTSSSETEVTRVPELPDAPVDPSHVVLAKLAVDAFKGGRVLNDVAKKGVTARAIFGQKTPDNSLSARFDLRLPSRGAGRIVVHTVRLNNEPCGLAVGVNGHEIFRGSESARTQNAWTVQSIALPAGIVQAGRNELSIVNTDPSGSNVAPQIVIGAVEIFGAEPAAPVIVPENKTPAKNAEPEASAKNEPAFAPVITADQRATLQFMENVFVPLAKYDQDTAVRLAGTDTSVAGKKLEAVVIAARDVFNKATAAINKGTTPLNVQASSGKLNVSGQVTRIEGGKAWIKEKGLEVPVDLAALPAELFVKALAADESTPDGRLQRALLNLALGNIQNASALMKRAGNHAPSADLASVLTTYAQLSALQKFDAEVNELAALKEGQLQELPARLKSLQQSYPQLAAVHKERLAYLASRGEVKK